VRLATRWKSEVGTQVGTACAFAASLPRLSRATMWFRRSQGGLNGRGWDRTSDLPRVKRALSR
jgi:hypothetical protein